MDFGSFSKWMFERRSCSDEWNGSSINDVLDEIQMMEPLHFKNLRMNARSRRDTESKASISKVHSKPLYSIIAI